MRVENYEWEVSQPGKKQNKQKQPGRGPTHLREKHPAKGPKHGLMKAQRSGHHFVWMIFEVHKRKMWCMIRKTQGDKGSL